MTGPGADRKGDGFIGFRILTAVYVLTVLTGMNNQSGLHENVQAAFHEEAERAYRDIIAYDENARVSEKELIFLYGTDALLAPLKRAFSLIQETAADAWAFKAPADYAGRCVYEGKIRPNAPEGVVFVRAHLLPFTPEQARIYDESVKNSDFATLESLYRPLMEQASACRGAYNAENGFKPYIAMQDGSSLVPVALGVLYLSDEVTALALSMKKTGGISPPVRDARGVLILEYAGDHRLISD